jgi:hypothetical protein
MIALLENQIKDAENWIDPQTKNYIQWGAQQAIVYLEWVIKE